MPVDSPKGLGLAARFEQWLSKQRQGARGHQADHQSACSPAKRPASPTAVALLLHGDTHGEEASVSPETMLKRLHATLAPDSQTTWRCEGCNTTDRQWLVKGSDSTMACSRCSVVAGGVKMIGLHREKACSAEDDRTQHADAPKRERDFFCGDEVETAAQARSRHAVESGGCCIPSKVRRRSGIGNVESKITRVAAAEHRAMEEELNPLNTTRNRALQIELVSTCKLLSPVDASLQRHVRITAHQLLVRSQIHGNVCCSGCEISLAGVATSLVARVLIRVTAETLLPLHGKEECPFRFECSREELCGLIDRCNRLVIKEGVHSALCRAAIDLLLNGDYSTPCKVGRSHETIPPSLSLAKNGSMEILSGDAVGTVRDTIWSLSKAQTIADAVRNAVLHSLRLSTIREWVVKEAAVFTCDIVALRLARAVNANLDPGNAQSERHIVASTQRACQRSSTSMSSFAMDTEVASVVANAELVVEEADDDTLI